MFSCAVQEPTGKLWEVWFLPSFGCVQKRAEGQPGSEGTAGAAGIALTIRAWVFGAYFLLLACRPLFYIYILIFSSSRPIIGGWVLNVSRYGQLKWPSLCKIHRKLHTLGTLSFCTSMLSVVIDLNITEGRFVGLSWACLFVFYTFFYLGCSSIPKDGWSLLAVLIFLCKIVYQASNSYIFAKSQWK